MATACNGTFSVPFDIESNMPSDLSPDPIGPLEPLPEPGLLTRVPVPLRWIALLALSVVVAWLLLSFHVPAALMLGPMIAAIIAATNGARLSVGQIPFLVSHALIGCMVGRSLDAEILSTFASDWPVFVSVVFAVIAATSAIGYLMARNGTLPGTTAIWGTSAGAASAMLLMSEAYGADSRLVAFMQYLRVVCVASSASLVATLLFHATGGEAEPIVWFPPVNWMDFTKTMLVAGVACVLGKWLRIPAGTMLLPMIATAVLHGMGWLTIELPTWVLVAGYALLGWKIGLGFTRRSLRHAARALPQILLSIIVLIIFCGGLAVLLWQFLGIDPLTAFLATSPGGLDTIVIIAASTPVDISFVLALQTARFVLILILGGPISKFVARRLAP